MIHWVTFVCRRGKQISFRMILECHLTHTVTIDIYLAYFIVSFGVKKSIPNIIIISYVS